MQGKLLRLLEEREFTPVGGNRTRISNARFIAATNVELEQKVADGDFREDLYYRLNVVCITLPPLRERREDISLLVEHLLKKINREIHKSVRRVPTEVMEALRVHAWPGNVRQLENVLMKAVVMAPGDTLSIAHLPDEVVGDRPVPPAEVPAATAAGDFKPLKELERLHIEQVLASTGWHKGRTCEILGITRPRLERRIKEFGLTPPE